MATAAQITANRVNAQQSTGPRTEAGKASSSQNAIKHGLSSKTLVILPGQQDAFTELEAMLRRQFSPEPGYQEFVFHRILHAAWNQHRCDCAEFELHAESPNPNRDPLLTEELERKLRLLAVYATRAERSFHKYVKELRDLQNEARYRRETEATSEPSVLTEVTKVDAAIDKSDKGRGRRDIVIAANAEQTLRAHFAKQESESDGFSLGRFFRR